MAPNPYKSIRFGDLHGPKPYKFIGFGDLHGPKPYKFIGFGHGFASLGCAFLLHVGRFALGPRALALGSWKGDCEGGGAIATSPVIPCLSRVIPSRRIARRRLQTTPFRPRRRPLGPNTNSYFLFFSGVQTPSKAPPRGPESIPRARKRGPRTKNIKMSRNVKHV